MTEPEIPDCCKKYDELIVKIYELNEKIKELETLVAPRTESYREYLQIVNDSTCNGAVKYSYFLKKLNEINEVLLESDKKIIENINKVEKLEEELKNLIPSIQNSGFTKVSFMFGSVKWITCEEYRSMANKLGVSQIV